MLAKVVPYLYKAIKGLEEKGVDMTKASKVFLVVGCLLMLLAVVSRVTVFQIMITKQQVQYTSFLILSNTAFILALLFKK